MSELFFGIFIGLVIGLFVAIVDRDYSQPHEHHLAEEVCAKNGGYEEIGFSFVRDYEIICNDGATFYRTQEVVFERAK